MKLVPPLSKSDAQRALVLADILGVPFDAVLPPSEALPRDVEVLRAGLVALRAPAARIDCRDGGAPFRFLLTQAAVIPQRQVEFVGTERLGARPHAPLVAALRVLPGLQLVEGAPWPWSLRSGPLPRERVDFAVTGEQSSQYASSLLLGAARLAVAGVAVRLKVEGAMTSEGYFALTCTWLARCGFGLHREQGWLQVLAPAAKERLPAIPGDWSSLGYLLALSWVSGLPVDRIALGTGHPDEAIAAHLAGAGLQLSDRVVGTPTGGFFVDAEQCPDAVPTLAVWATRLPAVSEFQRVGVLRHKESDRLEGILALLGAAGLQAACAGDVLTVHPGQAKDFQFDALEDHRLAMSAAVLARLHKVKVRLKGMASVSKSFPGFWGEAAKAAVQVEGWP